MLKEYFSVFDIVELKIKGLNKPDRIHALAISENWLFQFVRKDGSDKPVKEYHISNFPYEVREKIVNRLLEKEKKEAKNNGKSIEFVQESLRIAYSRLEIVLFIRKSQVNILSFCNNYNNRELINTELTEVVYENIPSISKSRVYDWIKAYDKLGLEGLKYKADERRLGKGNFQENENLNIEQLVIGALLNKPHLKAKLIYKFLVDLAKKKALQIPSYRTVCRIISNYKKNNKQEFLLAKNPDAWKSKYLLAIGSYSDGITEPNQLWELDSSPADVMLEGGRYMILACIDVYSRRVKFLVNKTSNSLGITSLLRACMLEWGIPKCIKTDNGKDYTSQQIKIVLNEFGIEHKLANPFQGQEKPHVERVFKRFQHDFVECLPNYVGHNVAERKALQSIKTFEDRLFGKEEVLSLSANSFQGFCNWWIETQYMNVPHHGIDNKTPNSKLEGFIPKLPVGEQVHILSLLLEPLAGLRTIVKKGIRVENTNYFNPCLAMYIGEKVQVRVDRLDMGKIYVFDEKNVFICEAVNYELLGIDKQKFIQQSKAIQRAVVKEVKTKTKRLINKSKGKLDYLEPIQIELDEAIEEAKKKDILNGNTLEHKPFEITEEQRVIQQSIAEDLEFIIPEDKDKEFKLFLEYKNKEIQEEQLSSRIMDWLEQYPESTAGRVRIKFMLEHDEVKDLYKASIRVLQNLETLINV